MRARIVSELYGLILKVTYAEPTELSTHRVLLRSSLSILLSSQINTDHIFRVFPISILEPRDRILRNLG
jgi:hypothetical protein